MAKPIKRKLMVVQWLDHYDQANWYSLKDYVIDPWEVTSIGWVTAESDIAITLSTGIVENRDRCGYSMTILKAVIVESYEITF